MSYPSPSATSHRSILSRTPSTFTTSAASDPESPRCMFTPTASSSSSSSSRTVAAAVPASSPGSPGMARTPSAPLPSAGSTLLARRRSSASEKAASRPALGLTSLNDLHIADLAAFVKDPFAIREQIIGVAAASEVVHMPSSRAGDSPLRTPSLLGADVPVIERSFASTKVRLPTPFPEKRTSFLSDEEDEEDDLDESASDSDHSQGPDHRQNDVFSVRTSVRSTGSSVASSVNGDAADDKP